MYKVFLYDKNHKQVTSRITDKFRVCVQRNCGPNTANFLFLKRLNKTKDNNMLIHVHNYKYILYEFRFDEISSKCYAVNVTAFF